MKHTEHERLSSDPVKRCLNCFYVLDHLPSDQCPECGRAFDPSNPSTYTTKPPFIWWRYWLPGYLLAAALGLAAYAMLIPMMGFGWAVTLAIPVMIGGIVGYTVRVGKAAAIGVGWLAIIACLIGVTLGGGSGIFCMLILFAMAIIPLVVSVLAGMILRTALKRSRWGQRQWLPIVLLFLFPAAVAGVELRLPQAPVVVVETSRTIRAPLPAAWDGVMFYEEVTHDPPWLLWVGLRRPQYTIGQTNAVGDRKTCVYSRGRLTKEVTHRRPLEVLEFTVVEQEMFEDYSVRLIDGGFRFNAMDDAQTRITLTTRYRPLLHPRWAWQPVEEHVVHLLHGHVLQGMAAKAERYRATAHDTDTISPGRPSIAAADSEHRQ